MQKTQNHSVDFCLFPKRKPKPFCKRMLKIGFQNSPPPPADSCGSFFTPAAAALCCSLAEWLHIAKLRAANLCPQHRGSWWILMDPRGWFWMVSVSILQNGFFWYLVRCSKNIPKAFKSNCAILYHIVGYWWILMDIEWCWCILSTSPNHIVERFWPPT